MVASWCCRLWVSPMSDLPPDYEVWRNGKVVAGVFQHPRKIGKLLAVVPPRNHRDSGLKTYKSRAAAVKFVDQRVAEIGAEKGWRSE